MTKELAEQVEKIGGADILVGIPSYNNARTIRHVVRAVQAGLAKYFGDRKAVIVNSDGGSTDGTMDIVRGTTIEDFQSIFLSHGAGFFTIAEPYHGIPGKGSAFRVIFELANVLNAKACAVVDADLRSITPEWVELLIKPVLSGGFDYVAPLYHRHKFDGTITNSIVYPLTRALYGKRIRQPIGGDFGFSGSLAAFYLTKDVWETDVAKYGIDIWMTTSAVANGFKVCQAFLGAKIHDPKDPGADLSEMLYQVVGSSFELMEQYEAAWAKVVESEAVPTFGFHYTVGLEPVPVDVERMVEKFRLGVKELAGIWKEFLPEETIRFLEMAETLPEDGPIISDKVWAKIIYSFAIAAHKKAISREHLLKSLTPLYIGRTASFMKEAWNSDAAEVEEMIEKLCAAYEAEKRYLLDNWPITAKEA